MKMNKNWISGSNRTKFWVMASSSACPQGEDLLVSPKTCTRLLRALDDHFKQPGPNLTNSGTPFTLTHAWRETNNLRQHSRDSYKEKG